MNAAPAITLVLDGPLAIATLARKPVNAIDEAWLARLEDALETVSRASDVAVLVVRSTERAFCAGADLALMRGRMADPAGRSRMVAFVREIQRVFARLERLPQVTIAEIGGPALGGGLELALACDLRIAATDAKLGLPEASLGLLPGAGGTQRLTRIVGEAIAKRLILGAEVVSGEQAAALGLVQWAVPAAELAGRARSIANRITGFPVAALSACKRCVVAALGQEEDGYEMEIAATASLLGSADTQHRVREFLEKKR